MGMQERREGSGRKTEAIGAIVEILGVVRSGGHCWLERELDGTVYVAREDGCACRCTKRRGSFLTATFLS